MPDRPIIFSAPMVRALLEGRKTQTRRVLKPQPGDIDVPFQMDDGSWHVHDSQGTHMSPLNVRPNPDDRLWVREAIFGHDDEVFYKADQNKVPRARHPKGWYGFAGSFSRPSIHMPRWASRLTLTVTEVRVQRLQEISAEDCIAEGVPCSTCDAARSVGRSACNGRGCFEIKRNFRDLWTSIHGDAAWDQNPWVTAISFTVERRNIDA